MSERAQDPDVGDFYGHLFSIRDQVAVVTGGSSGIGHLIAEGLVRAGCRTYIASRKADRLEAVAEELSGFGTCIPLVADLSTVEGCESLASDIATRESGVHLLVNNAGLSWGAPLGEFPEKAWDRVIDLNAKGLFFFTQAMLPLLRNAASVKSPSSVVNIGSVNGIAASSLSNYSYTVSKAGVHMLTRQLAHELVRDHVNVNCIAPGPFKSRMTGPLHADEDTAALVADANPMGRWGRLEDIAGLTIFLSSRAGSYLTGTIIPLDGGETTRG